MEKVLFVLLLLLFIVGCESGKLNIYDGFRGNKWGSSIQDVKYNEYLKLSFSKNKEDQRVSYLDGNYKLDKKILVNVRYLFLKGKLYSGEYKKIDKSNSLSIKNCLNRYDQFKKIIEYKYGQPNIGNKWSPTLHSKESFPFYKKLPKDILEKDGLLEDEEKNWFCKSYLMINSEWEGDKTDISVQSSYVDVLLTIISYKTTNQEVLFQRYEHAIPI